MGGLRGLTRLVAFLKISVLVRILEPVEFGIFGIASILLAFLEILTDTGVNVFLIQEKKGIEKYINSAWFISIIRGFIISLILLVLAKPISIFFNSPNSYRVILLTTIVPFLKGFINPSIIKFQIELEFKKEFNFRLIVFSIDTFITIFLAIILKKAEGIVLGMAFGVIVEILFSWIFIYPRPRLEFEWSTIKKFLSRGRWITIASIFEYFFQHVDDIMVGKLLGSAQLGFYQVSYRVSTLPISEGGEVISKVVFPIYTKISNNKDKLKKTYFKVFYLTSLPTIFFGLFLIIFTRQFISLFLGSSWLEIVNVIKVLAVFGIIRAISGSSSVLFLSIKKQEYVSVVTFVSTLFLGISIFPLISKYGLVGAGYSTLIGSISALPFIFYFIKKELYGKRS